jgi:hypothetical protein
MRFTSYCISFLLSHHWPPPKQPLVPGHALLGRDEGCASRNHRALKLRQRGCLRESGASRHGRLGRVARLSTSQPRQIEIYGENLCASQSRFPASTPKKCCAGSLVFKTQREPAIQHQLPHFDRFGAVTTQRPPTGTVRMGCLELETVLSLIPCFLSLAQLLLDKTRGVS